MEVTVINEFGDPTSIKYRGNDPVPDSGEISGVGRYDCSKAEGSSCKDRGYAVYKVQQGKKYRFRIINTSAMAHFTVSFDGHPMTIIEVEGTHVKEYTVEYLPINIAERYSVIINCNQTVGNFWIKALIARCSIPYRPGDPRTINSNSAINYTVLGILRYEGAPESNPQSTGFRIPPPNCYDQDPSTLKPYKPEPPPSGDVETIPFTVDVSLLQTSNLLAATVNGQSFVPDFSYPTVKRLRDGMDPSRFLVTDNAYGFNISSGSPVEILIRNDENRTHPFHLVKSPDLLRMQLNDMPEEVSHLCDQFDNTNGLSHDPSMEPSEPDPSTENVVPDSSPDTSKQPDEDSYTPPDDSSTPPDDSYTPPDDSSTPPDDSSTPPDDSSTPPDDSSTPPDDSSTPPDDSSY
ncbi:4508_t:CDS:2 [Racocetra fulgida]|uniref:4508_t:CDS:1 n=1 Tax=Racocetra fulgida TaxID=60492 RepID=A0A9N9BSG6_9GLOM|nr:4508_t:CDS:2 [Racocetra fulgida]